MATQTIGLAQLLAAATARIGDSSGGVAIILAEGIVSAISPETTTIKGQRKKIVTIALLGGTREPQILKGKLVDQFIGLAEGLSVYDRVRVLATAADYTIDGKSFHVQSIWELEKVNQVQARPEAAA